MSKILQVRDVPLEVHRSLKARAAEQGRTLTELVREHLAEVAARPTLAEVLERLRAAEAAEPDETSAEAVHAGRDGG